MPLSEFTSPADLKLACVFRIQKDGSIKHTSWFVEPHTGYFRVLQYVIDNLQVLEEQHTSQLRLDHHHIQVLPELSGETWSVFIHLDTTEGTQEYTTGNVYHSVFKYAALPMALLDLEGNLRQVNDAFTRLLGYSRDELLTMTLQSVTHPEDLHTDQHETRLLLERKVDSYQQLKRFMHREGRVLWALSTVAMILRRDGSPQFLLVQLQDETESLQYRDHLEKQTQTLEEAQRRAGMATFQIDPVAQTVVFSGSVRELVAHWKGTIKFTVLQQDLGEEAYSKFLQWLRACQSSQQPTEVQLILPGGRQLLLRGWATEGAAQVLGVVMHLTGQVVRIS